MLKQIPGFVLLLLSCTLVWGGNGKTFTLPDGLTPSDYQAQTIILKVKESYRPACQVNGIEITSLQSILNGLGSASVKKVFPLHQPPTQARNEYGFPYADLSLIYEITYSADANLIKVINSVLQTGIAEYCEPKYIPRTCYNPNDPQIGMQNFLQRINAFDGWDISKGDTNTVIGITDTGTDWDHPDLAPNLKLNYADPINGIDDDGDGYTDNYRGWDLGEGDNDPIVGSCGTCDHGSHVSGCAAAVTDNNTGVASPGFNCRFLPVKIASATGALSQAYEGIVYAADHGCQIINCSWGGGGGGSFGQTVIDYATINKNSLVIAAAGNNSSSQLFYPAAYNYILCVAATNSSNDVKASFSNYGIYIDVCAPGNSVYSTVHDDSYTYMSGTSMASPVTAGVAAIVKSYFPSYNALQVGEQIRSTTDNIYSLPGNSPYSDDLGTGRINLLNALTLSGPSVRINPINVSDHNDGVYIIGDSLYITGDIINYLSPTTNLDVTLTTSSAFVTLVDNYTFVGALGTMGVANNNADPFIVKINSNAPQNSVIQFKLLIQDGSYIDFQMFNVTVNVDYMNITINDVWTTNTSKGRLCYNSTAQAEGLGFDFLSQGTITYETGFMAGTGSIVADNVRGATGTDNDWAVVSVIQKNDPGILSDFDTYGAFSDAGSTQPMGLDVSHRSFSWSSPPNHRFHIFEYTLHNNGSAALSNLYAGIFSDWDIQDYNHNKADEDASLKMGYVWNTDAGGYYAGIKLLTSGPFNHYAIDNITGGSGGVDLTAGGYSNGEKYTTLSTSRATAGGAGVGNDVIDVVSTGPFNLNQGDSITVAFALLASNEMSDLASSANAAQIAYNSVTGIDEELSVTNLLVYPNPSSGVINIYYNLSATQPVKIEVTDISGRQLKCQNNKQSAGVHTVNLDLSRYAKGFYLVSIDAGGTRHVQKVLLTGR